MATYMGWMKVSGRWPIRNQAALPVTCEDSASITSSSSSTSSRSVLSDDLEPGKLTYNT